jgi:ribonuclease VapC
MIVVDTSALIAIQWGEPEGPAFSDRMTDEDGLLISSATRLEAFLTCRRRRGLADALVMERLIQQLGIVTIPFDEAQLVVAREAYDRYGGANGLTFGDCFAYALAKTRGLPLLFKGEDFLATDVEAAV